jgi:hypothetical protein
MLRDEGKITSFEKPGTARGNDNDDGTESETLRSNCKHNVGILTRGEDSEVYVRRFAQLREGTKTEEARQHLLSNKVENKRCPNSGTISTLQASFGNCSELVPLEALLRGQRSLMVYAVLFSRTLSCPTNRKNL